MISSSFYYWRRTAPDRAARQAADARLAARIRAVHHESDGTYGAPRTTAALREESGEAVNHQRVSRIMRVCGIEGVRLRRRHRTTDSDPAAVRAPDLIGRNFTATAPNTKYVGDITYLPIEGGKFCYLATVVDLSSRRLAGWAIADRMRAPGDRRPGSGDLHPRHSRRIDHAHGPRSPYASTVFAEACRSAGVPRSMSAVGSRADNALAESFNATFKHETLKGRKSWPTEHEARLDALRWLHRYNTRRRHSRLGHSRLGQRSLPRTPPPHTNYAGTSRITRVRDSESRPLRRRARGGCADRVGCVCHDCRVEGLAADHAAHGELPPVPGHRSRRTARRHPSQSGPAAIAGTRT
ncbi:hypothetical protein GCM10028832_01820 [Streptomyces sparsus]